MPFTTFDTELTAYLREVVLDEPREQNFYGNVMLDNMLNVKEHEVRWVGGRYIHINITHVGTPAGGSFRGNDTLNVTGTDDAEVAEERVAHYYEPVRLLKTDMDEATGPGAKFKYAEHQMRQSMKRLKNKLATDLWATSQVSTKDLVPLPVIMTNDGTGAVHGLTNTTWWENQDVNIGSFSSNETKVDELLADCLKDGESDWDYIVSDKATWLKAKVNARANHTNYTYPRRGDGSGRTADEGYPHVELEGKPWYYDRNCIADTMHVIAKHALKLARGKNEFSLGPWVEGETFAGKSARLYWSGQVLCFERSALGKGHTISA